MKEQRAKHKLALEARHPPAVTESESESEAASGEVTDYPPLPDDALIIVPVRNVVLFPGIVVPLVVGRPMSIAAAKAASAGDRPIGVLLQREAGVAEPGADDLYTIGTVAEILRYIEAPDGTHHVICQGEQRFRVIEFLMGYPFLAARVERLEEDTETGAEIEARFIQLRTQALEILQLLPNAPTELANAVQAVTDAGALADMVAGFIDIKPGEKQEILDALRLRDRLEKILWYLAYRIEVLRISRDIGQQAKETMEARQREHLLREHLRTIQKELGEGEEGNAEIAELDKSIAKAGMPEEVEAHARKELKRLERIPEAAGEYAMVRTYLDWLVELPWTGESGAAIDIKEARRILDEDHYGLAKVKRRILEYLAVRKLNPQGKGTILCFVGPPGVGKTSLGQSIARATGRKFVRVSLGGLHDEAEIRGHRRTYIGALPGNVIQAIRKAGARDCVLMLDEIDKLGAGFHGDPSAALLEVLDPEQNAAFRDNYLAVPFDLSRVMFIATANMLDTIPGPLQDRMEVIEIPGYTESEKLEIARRYLVRRQLAENGLTAEQCEIADDALRAIVRDYTRESGCRNLEREIGAVFRRVAMQVAEGEVTSAYITAALVPEILGPRKFESEIAMRTSVPGVATGLAWTPVGGDILFVEATRMPGAGHLILTGHLGEVMKESAQAALSLVKTKASALGLAADTFAKSDIHIHVPAGAIPKDGPSAGVAIYAALVSLLTERTVRSDTAMTGEISLRGLVLPVGGIKEKVVAAVRAGIKTVVLPARNRKDLEEVPDDAKKRARFVFVEDVDEAAKAVLDARERGAAPSAESVEAP